MPSTLGRACHHPCELRCTRTHLDEPLAIRELKRHAMEHGARPGLEPPPLLAGPRVVIIGAGPCGLSAALELRRHGAPVTVLERRSRAGGMVTATIPGFRATDEAVQDDLAALEAAGVEVCAGVEVGGADGERTVQGLLDEGFEHVIVGGGAQRGTRLGLEGEESLAGVVDGLELLRQARAGTAPGLGPRVLVIGGGDVAVDCARTARRLSSGEVRIVYRRTIAQMPAQAEELRLLAAERIWVDELLAPLRFEAEGGRLVALHCQCMRLVAPDPPGSGGRPRPEPIPGAEQRLEADAVIIAIGQQPDLAMFGEHLPELTPSGWIAVDPETFETSLPGVSAGGDIAAGGPATIVAAAADGRRIARHILEQAGIEPRDLDIHREPVRSDQLAELLIRRSRRWPRVAIPEAPPDRRAGFREVVGTLDPATARIEASRCLACDRLCSTCVTVCPNRALFTYRIRPATLRLPLLRPGPDGLESTGETEQETRQELQVALIADLCNGCGNCRTFCPTAGAPYLDKPRIHLDPAGFDEAGDGAYRLAMEGDAPATPALCLATRRNGQLHTVTLGSALDYDGPQVRLRLDRTTHDVLEVGPTAGHDGTGGPSQPDLEPCATLITLIEGLAGSMPGLLAWTEAEHQDQGDRHARD
jgi:putative selenate reductase